MIERDNEAVSGPTTGYEITFPAASLGRTSFTTGDLVAIGVCVNDGDQDAGQHGQKGWSGWGPYSAVHGKTPSETGLVTLTGTTPPATCDAGELDMTGSSRQYHNAAHGTAGR